MWAKKLLENPIFNYSINAIEVICTLIVVGALWYAFKNRKNKRSRRR